MGQVPRRRPFRPHGQQNQQGQPRPRPRTIRAASNPRQAAANACHNYERYTNLAKEAARRGETIEAENLYQHAEHYYRVMRDQD